MIEPRWPRHLTPIAGDIQQLRRLLGNPQHRRAVERQHFSAATAEITGHGQALMMAHDVEHVEHHGALILLRQQRQQ
jgi:hypothetical protein